MKLIIDAYNLFKQLVKKNRLTEQEQRRLINCIKKYSNRKNHEIELVFDGGFSAWLSREVEDRVTIVFVGGGKSADAYIKAYIENWHTKDILLISSDHELQVWADQYDIASLGALDFWHFVQESAIPVAKNKNMNVVKMDETASNSELDALMYSVKNVPKKDSTESQERVSHKAVESKINKRLLQKIKKL